MKHVPRKLLSFVLGIALLCGPACTPAIARWTYTVTLDEALGVKLCLSDVGARRLVPADPSEAERVIRAYHGRSRKPLSATPEGLALPKLRPRDCVALDVSIRDAFDREGLLLPTDAWLWRPDPLPQRFRASVVFELPQGWVLSAPWPRTSDDGPYELDRTAFRWESSAVAGPTPPLRFDASGTAVELTVLGPQMQATPEDLRAWLTDALRTASFVEGAALPKSLQAIVISHASPGGGPVFFGMATRGGGPGVMLHARASASGPELLGGWTTTHEVLHHTMPFIAEPWMAEGWVSYYTELVRTRAGHRSEREGWQALFEAFERGRTTSVGDRTLRQASATMHAHRGYQRVYWGGAAIAFLTDVALRTSSVHTLDAAVAELARLHPVPTAKRLSAHGLLEALDAWHGQPVFTEVAAANLDVTDFPSVAPAFATLGIGVVDGEVVLHDDHPNATIRRAIMAPRGTPRRGRSR